MKPQSVLMAALSLSLLGPALSGCPKEQAQKPKKAPPKKAPPKKAPPKPAASKCVPGWSTAGATAKIEAGGKTFERTGTLLKETSTDADKQISFGVIANIKEDTEGNLKNLAKFVAYFKKEKAEAIIVDGDLGETKAQIEKALAPLQASGLPVFAVIGNRERNADFNAALDPMQAKGVFNLNAIRMVQFDDAAIVSMPGYYDKTYIHATDGCQYTKADVDGTKPIIAAAGGKPVILVSHGGPKQEGSDALDYTQENANVGDPMLAALMRSTKIKFGVFANIQEAGGKATDLSGKSLIGENKWADELLLNPGAVDSISWPMNDGTRSVGMATILTIKDGKASFKAMRLRDE